MLKKIGVDDIVNFDYNKYETFDHALEGVNAIFSNSPDNCLPGHMKLCELIKERSKDINHIVRLSCFGAEQNTSL